MKFNKRFIAIAFFYIALVVLVTILLWPYVDRFNDPAFREEISAKVASFGLGGWFLMFGVQIFQIIFAFIPGGPVELITGMLYGVPGGFLLCLAGSVAGSAIVFTLTRRLGARFAVKLFDPEKSSRYAFLRDSRKITLIVFLLFLIPGMPKDMLSYLAGLSSIKTGEFLVISNFARAPAILSSVIIGSTLWKGTWQISILVFLLTALVGVAGIFNQEKIINACRRFGRTRGKKNDGLH
ncbi:MAG: VTT domain-containing protein [Gracilibacteraceae bacterium]|jgi:uncharacterized membrane protein YdjX (TVP38/TMEM64 family)|nr:VTT domain-containing protein [Gracilibacteraceae bacterium]